MLLRLCPALAALAAMAFGMPGDAGAAGDAPDVMLTVTPLGHEQVIAFYGARGFEAAALAPYAGACVLSFTLRNDGTTTVRSRLAEWTVGGSALIPVDTWDKAWADAGVATAARIAFRWAQFPPEQSFAPGDWIMGMAVPASRPTSPFRIAARYSDEKGQHELVSEPLACAD